MGVDQLLELQLADASCAISDWWCHHIWYQRQIQENAKSPLTMQAKHWWSLDLHRTEIADANFRLIITKRLREWCPKRCGIAAKEFSLAPLTYCLTT